LKIIKENKLYHVADDINCPVTKSQSNHVVLVIMFLSINNYIQTIVFGLVVNTKFKTLSYGRPCE